MIINEAWFVVNVDSIACDAFDFEGMSGETFLLAREPNAVIETATSGS